MGNLNTNKRRQLWNTDPHCYWCHVVTIEPVAGLTLLSRDHATFDHLYQKRTPERSAHPSAGVLACWRCNYCRAIRGADFDPKAERQRRIDAGLPVSNAVYEPNSAGPTKHVRVIPEVVPPRDLPKPKKKKRVKKVPSPLAYFPSFLLGAASVFIGTGHYMLALVCGAVAALLLDQK